jgi:putative ABC transport system substrate-binding protein
MKKCLFAIIVLLAIICCTSAWAYEIAVIKSVNIKPYDEAERGFESICKANIREFVISESNGSEMLKNIYRIKPDLILAIGIDALSQIKRIKDIPIIYAMVSNPHSMLSGEKNITGVSMDIPAEKQLSTLLKVSPDIKRIGIVYDPGKTIHLFKKARTAATTFGITLIQKAVHSPKEVPSAINDMKGKIDAFWLLPDTTVVTQESVEYLLLFSFENGIATLAFSDKYVEIGLLMALNIDAIDIGRQAGEMANKILDGTNVSNIPMSPPRKAVLSLNLKTATRLGINVDDEIIKKSKIIY